MTAPFGPFKRFNGSTIEDVISYLSVDLNAMLGSLESRLLNVAKHWGVKDYDFVTKLWDYDTEEGTLAMPVTTSLTQIPNIITKDFKSQGGDFFLAFVLLNLGKYEANNVLVMDIARNDRTASDTDIPIMDRQFYYSGNLATSNVYEDGRALFALDSPSAGTYRYFARMGVSSFGDTVGIGNPQILVLQFGRL